MNYNTAAMLSYLPNCLCCIGLIFSIIFFATEPKESKFVRFHALQALLLAAVNLVVGVVFYILRIALATGSTMTPDDVSSIAFGGGNAILGLLNLVISLGLLVIHIIGMVKANQMQMWKLPIIGDIADKNS